jgi:hypothetical protein
MTTKKNIRTLTFAAFLALGVVFGVCACQGPKPDVPTYAPSPAPK